MPNIFIIIGEDNTRKSSTIRALTGASKRNVYQVATINQHIQIFVQISALQEQGKSPQQFMNEITQMSCPNVLLSLRINAVGRQPNSLTYIQNFLGANWCIREIVVLGTNQLPYNLPNNLPTINYIPNARNMTNNEIASKIRQWWQWL
jgi:hypothetical protein